MVLLGTEMEDATTIDMITDIGMTHPQTKTLVLGVNERPETILRYVEAGASGYILQNESLEDMVNKLKSGVSRKSDYLAFYSPPP